MKNKNGIVFVSGHLDLTKKEFDEHYRTPILVALGAGKSFVIGDAKGCDAMAQRLIDEVLRLDADRQDDDVVVYHMLRKPRNNIGKFSTVGGFKSDEERDQEMTFASTEDIAWVRPGREKSGTAKNLARRKSKKEMDDADGLS